MGVWQIDAFCYKTPGYFIRRYGPRLFDPRAWVNSIRVRLRQPREDNQESDIFVAPEHRRVFPERTTVQAGLGQLLNREVALFFFFTGGQEEYIYATQHADAFGALDLGGRAEVHYVRECTHMVTGLEHQRRFVRDLRGWVARMTGPTEATAVVIGDG